MTAAERAQLLRDRFKERFPIAAKAPTKRERSKPRYVVLPKPSGRGFVSCGPAMPRKSPVWVATPDARTKPALGLKRRQGVPVLAKIAQKAKRPKLARLKLREPWELPKVNL